MKMNKIGGERILSFWWFFILGLIAVAIIVVVIMFYSSVIDVRGLEAEILAGKIADCIVVDSKIDSFMLNPDFYSRCGLNKQKSDLFYAEIKIYDYDSCTAYTDQGITCSKEVNKLVFGNNHYAEYCELQKESHQSKLPICVERDVYTMYNNQRVIMHITAASNQKSGEIWKS